MSTCVTTADNVVQTEVDWSTEAKVDPNSVAGDYRGVTGNRIVIDSFKSEFVEDRNVEIWLPEGYDPAADTRYPVVYMHDGQNVFDPAQSEYSGWDWGVDEAITAMIASGDIQPAIIVAPHSIQVWRNKDYFPQKAATQYPGQFGDELDNFDADDLRGDAYLKFLTGELKPYIDRTYKTRPEREYTSVMGSSMGGLISLYAISEYPDIYGAAANVSTHFPLSDGLLVDFYADKLPDPDTHRIYFDYGTLTLDYNYEPYQDRMNAAMMAAGYERGENWTTRKFDGADHSERSWRNRVHIPLTFLINSENIEGGKEK